MGYMSHAIELARLAEGNTNPNPPVGAVIVKNGEVVGEGFTQPAGDSHAEIVALKQAGSSSLGAALYSTLEPCNHQGRTPPCSQAIIDAGIIIFYRSALVGQCRLAPVGRSAGGGGPLAGGRKMLT